MNRPDSSQRPVPAVIDLVPATDRASLGDTLARLVSRIAVAAVVAVLCLVVVRLAVAVIFHHQIAGGAAEFARIAGLDARLSAWLTGVVAWTAGLALMGMLCPILLATVWPFASGVRLWKPALVLLAVSGLGAAAPSLVMAVRGVDITGMPAAMKEVNPAVADWFSPAGTALLFYADHLDGERRFWNRPGSTPRDRAEAKPVTPGIHNEWLRAGFRPEAARAGIRRAEPSRQGSKPSVESPRFGSPAAAPEAETLPRAAVPPGPESDGFPADRVYRLLPGRALQIHVNGATVEVRANGRTVMWADERPKRIQPLPGHDTLFEGYRVVRVFPLDSRATEVTLRTLRPSGRAIAQGATRPGATIRNSWGR